MKTIIFDLDTLRPDHLGCYGYGRNTSPNIDSVARESVVFDGYYCPNAPCLPSRASFLSGRYGISTGIVAHGGTAADMVLEGRTRMYKTRFSQHNLFQEFRNAGAWTASISPFAERHSAWWFCAGMNEIINTGRCGSELGEEILKPALGWLERNLDRENWMLHINMWDAHTPYRTPKEYGDPFRDVPLPDAWIDEEVFRSHLQHIGPHSAREINMWNNRINPNCPRYPGELKDLSDVKKLIDGYDTGISYMDACIGKILDYLKEKGVYDQLNIIVTGDHGENLGELGIYSEHGTADLYTCRIPLIVKWQNGKKNVRRKALHDNVDLAPTVCDLLGLPVPEEYQGESFAESILGEADTGKSGIVLTQGTHVVQRGYLWNGLLYIRTYHGGFHLFDRDMLFDLEKDPREQHNIAAENPEAVARAKAAIFDWEKKYLAQNPTGVDPLLTVLREGGPTYTLGEFERYAERLEQTGRAEGAKLLRQRYKQEGDGTLERD